MISELRFSSAMFLAFLLDFIKISGQSFALQGKCIIKSDADVNLCTNCKNSDTKCTLQREQHFGGEDAWFVLAVDEAAVERGDAVYAAKAETMLAKL